MSEIRAPITGSVWSIDVAEGDTVRENDVLLLLG